MVVANYQSILAECRAVNPEVELVAVSKKQPIDKIQALISAVPDVIIGESYLQEWLDKKTQLVGNYQVHFIGNLQSNKVKKVVENFNVIQSVSSDKLVRKIQQAAADLNKQQVIYLQVNISDDENKVGFTVEDLLSNMAEYNQLANLKVIGLMTITMNYSDQDLLAKDFQQMSNLRDQLSELLERPLELSMGMSADYLLAIKYGANIVRVGSKIFGEREY